MTTMDMSRRTLLIHGIWLLPAGLGFGGTLDMWIKPITDQKTESTK